MRWFPQVFVPTMWRRNAFTRYRLRNVPLCVDQRIIWPTCWYANNRRMNVFGKVPVNLMHHLNVDIQDKINWPVWLPMRNVHSWMGHVRASLPSSSWNVREGSISWLALSWLIQVRSANSILHAWIWGWLRKWDVETYWMWIQMPVERLLVSGVTMIRWMGIVRWRTEMRNVLLVAWINWDVYSPPIVPVNGTLHLVLALNLW